MKDYKSLPYSDIFEDHLSRKEEAVQESYDENIAKFKGVAKIEFNDNQDGSTVRIKITLNNKKVITKKIIKHLDQGALELDEIPLQAYWGVSKKDLSYYLKELATVEDIQAKEPLIYEQLCREYILSTCPHNDGGQMLDQDIEEIMELIKE